MEYPNDHVKMINHRSPLPDILRRAGVDTVLVAGTVSNVCCESSVRDAATLGFRVVLVADATAAPSDQIHNVALTSVYRSFGDVPVGCRRSGPARQGG